MEAYGNDPCSDYEKVRNEFKKKIEGKPFKIGDSVTAMIQPGSDKNQYCLLAAIYAEQENKDTVVLTKSQQAD